MLNPIQFSLPGIKQEKQKKPKVGSRTPYKFPKPMKTKEELELIEAKARLMNAKASQINSQNQA